MAPSTTTQRPGPPNPQSSSKALHPIYQALDTRNYVKAIKLTSPNLDHGSWDIVKALRIHAYDRSGKKREALCLLWELLTSSCGGGDENGEIWWELMDKMEVMTDAADLMMDVSNNDGHLDLNLLDAIQRMNAKCFALDVTSLKRAAIVSAAESIEAPVKTQSKSSKQGKGKKSSANTSKAKPKPEQPIILPPITDETVLETLAVSLKIDGLYDTMSEMYHQAAVELGRKSDHLTIEQYNEYGSVLEEAVCVHFKAICDCSSITTDSNVGPKSYTLQDLETQQRVTKYYERMQSAALQLAKHSNEALHFQWTAVASLWYRDSLGDLVTIMQYFHKLLNTEDEIAKYTMSDSEKDRIKGWLVKILQLANVDDIPSKCSTYEQKMGLLPRLAESLSYRMIQNKLQDSAATATTTPDDSKPKRRQYAPSEADWDVYLETLMVQNKLEEALHALREINCSPLALGGESGDSSNAQNAVPQIHDEDTITNHVGTILPYTQRKKLEQMSRIGLKLGKFHEAEGWFKELLSAFPDQWTYWLGLTDSCVVVNGLICEEGWVRCQTFAKEVGNEHPTLRGPDLFLVELVALKIRHCSDDNKGNDNELFKELRKMICEYGDKFSSVASCCFADLRPYLELIVECSSRSVANGVIAEEVSLLLKWANGLWMIHSQSSDGNSISEKGADANELRERRRKLRTYIFAIQVCYCLAAALRKTISLNESLVAELLQSHTPTMNEMMAEWRTSLAFLPGVPPKDGGQKETLPGDEIVLLMSQYLEYKASCKSNAASSERLLVAAAGLLEEAIENSPYNPHLKIAAIGVYSRLNGVHRAYEHYQDMGVRHVQLDSCIYLILPVLIRGGFYTQAIQLSSSLLKFHGSTSKDIKQYSTKAFQKGYLMKAKEMMTFQRQKMRSSVQLLQAKGLVMDCAVLLNATDLIGAKQKSENRLGAEKGLCGCDEDVVRADQLVRDAEGHFNAPSVIHCSSNAMSIHDYDASDNRDMSVNYFEILHQRSKESQFDIVSESLLRGYTQSLLIHAVMVTDVAKTPKKGKVPKNTEAMLSRCQSMLNTIKKAKQFVDTGDFEMNTVDKLLWDVTCSLCNVIAEVVQGNGSTDPTDTLAERESTAVSLIELATACLSKAQSAVTTTASDELYKLVPDRIVPLFTLIETTARLFALFGWGKRKRSTKETAGALANLALLFKAFLSDALQMMKQSRVFDCSGADVEFDIGTEYVQKAIDYVKSSRAMTIDRVDPFLVEMTETLQTFANEES
eukprot:scaffold19553_cov64-Cyclotella_meneghiniana.AAC.6